MEDARAAVASAEAAIDRARRDLERAEVRAPYAGRVQSKDVDVGQFVNRGTAVGRIYAVDSAEVRLPLPDDELAYVDVPMSYRGTQQRTGPAVTLSADFAGRRYSWRGRIVRTEGEIDAVSRMVHVVAEVNDPYAPGPDPTRPPLAVGMFVEAEIAGRRVDDVVVLPWAALNGRDRVLIVDVDGRLRYRQVEVLRSTTESVLVSGGLEEGDLVSISALDAVVDGMAVQIAGGDPAMLGAGRRRRRARRTGGGRRCGEPGRGSGRRAPARARGSSWRTGGGRPTESGRAGTGRRTGTGGGRRTAKGGDRRTGSGGGRPTGSGDGGEAQRETSRRGAGRATRHRPGRCPGRGNGSGTGRRGTRRSNKDGRGTGRQPEERGSGSGRPTGSGDESGRETGRRDPGVRERTRDEPPVPRAQRRRRAHPSRRRARPPLDRPPRSPDANRSSSTPT